MNRLLLWIDRLEDSLLVLILTCMILLASTQIVMRNFLGEGIIWIDPLLRLLVLWIALAGAIVATRSDNHIHIDIFRKQLPASWEKWLKRLVYLLSSLVCLTVGWYAARFVISEYRYGGAAFGEIPSWIGAVIIPVGFLSIGLRYFLLLIHTMRSDISEDNG